MKNYKQFIGENMKDLNLADQWFNAIKFGDIRTVKHLIDSGIDINTKSENNHWTGLISAAIHNQPEIIKLLLSQNDIDVNCVGTDGRGALMRTSNSNIVKMLLDYPGIDVNIQGKNKYTALLSSSLNGFIDIVKLLLSHPKIDITIENDIGCDFIQVQGTNERYFLKDYELQKKILDNNRTDIILFLNEHRLVHPKIKKEYPHLFAGVDLNLL
jgi:ankyrin repeat protein